MKKILLIVVTQFFCWNIDAQEVYIQVGKILSSFKYQDSAGQNLPLDSDVNNSLGFGFRGPFDFSGDRLYLSGGINFNKYSASGTDSDLGNSYSWETNYIGPNLGLEFDLKEIQNIQIYLKGLVSVEFLLQGTQSLNNAKYDLKGKEQFKGAKVFLSAGAGASYTVRRDITLFTYYLAGRNFFNIGEGNKSGEDLDIAIQSINVGLFLRLQNYPRFR